MDFRKLKEQLLFIPLGGSGEIGMNVNLYHYQGKWIMADLGAGFAEDFMPGVDMLAPDISFIEKHKKDLLGIFLTHAHEDHLGSIPYLWDELQCPIYATPFTGAFLRAKLEDSGITGVPIHQVPVGGEVEAGPFKVELVELTHSVPEMNALAIRTDVGLVMHTGDWKFDPDPLIGPESDFEKLKKYGDEGITALVCDSTNIFSEGTSGSEGELRDSLIKLVGECDQMVTVATFASNVARIETIARAAQAAGRRVVLAGRSLWRTVRAAQESGYLTDLPDFLDDREFAQFKRKEILVIATGCQGEPLAATNKIANNNHPRIKLKPKDTIIFSSKIIPGNEKRIFRLFNRFIQMGVEVMTEKEHFVHVSGHPSRDEVKRMYELTRPQLAVPVHGEHTHMHEHAKCAKQWGAKDSIQVANGDVVSIGPGEQKILGQVKAGFYGIDGYCLQSPDSEIMRTRRKLQRSGTVIITLLMDHNEKLVKAPIIFAPGALDKNEDQDIFQLLQEEITDIVEEGRKQMHGGGKGKKGKVRKGKSSKEQYGNLTRSVVKRIFKQEMGKETTILVHIETV